MMIRHLVLKELHEHLLSLRFQVGFALALVLVSASAFALAGIYEHERAEFHQRIHQEESFLSEYAHVNRLAAVVNVSRPPSPAVLVRGLPRNAGSEALDGDPMAEIFPPMDLTAILAVVFSLLGIVLGFDAINGEKEQGTLRLMLANSVRRADVLTAKWVAGMLLLAIVLAAALLSAGAVVQVRAQVDWGLTDWLAGGAGAVVALTYCGVFFTLALCLSTLFRASAASVIAGLFAWVIFVLVVPNLAPYVAARVARVPSVAALERDLQFITSEERDDIGRAGEREVRARYPALAGLSKEEIERRIEVDPDFRSQYKQRQGQLDAVWAEVNRQQGQKAARLTEAWRAAAKRQFHLSRTLSYASPFPPLLYASMVLSDTGFENREAFGRQAQAYMLGLRQYANARFEEARRLNPMLDSNDFLDVSGRPRFSYSPLPLAERVDAALPHAGLLAGWVLLLFGAAVAGFVRFDVR
jgi:ABC-type transport system involved in multi-copper enzyme maturation permease subunit